MNKNSFVFYETFEEVINVLPDELQLKFYKTITQYALHDIEPSFTGLEAAVWISIKYSIDEAKARREQNISNGSKSKSGTKRNETTLSENEQIKATSSEIKRDEATLSENERNEATTDLNVNVNDNVNVNVNDTHNVNADDVASGVCAFPQQQKIYDGFQQELFDLIQNHNQHSQNAKKIPVSDDLISFTQKECRDILSSLRHEKPEIIKAALKNYILVAESNTWQKSFTVSSFIKNYQSYKPEFFDIGKYLTDGKIDEPEEEKAPPVKKFYWSVCNKCKAKYSLQLPQCPKCGSRERAAQDGPSYPEGLIE